MVLPLENYNLSLGYPDLSVAPKELLAGIASELISSGKVLQYGGDKKGAESIREQVAIFLQNATGDSVDVADLLITNGALQAIDLVCRALLRPGDIIGVEAPTFHDALWLFRLNKADLVSIPLGREGIDLDALEALLKQHSSRFRLLYTIPSYQNPTGICASAARREKLIELASEHDFLILEDAAYHFLYFEKPPPPLIKSLSTDDAHIITIGSFSKIVAPSLRQGWIWARNDLIEYFSRFKSDGCTSLLTSLVLADYLQSDGAEARLKHLRNFYAAKRARVIDALQMHLSPWASWTNPGGGFFVWVTLSQDLSASKLRVVAQDQGVDFLPGQACFADPAEDLHFRLCFSHLPSDALEEAIAILGTCLASMEGAG
jgi:2-aminoadipate transaminase